jgi:thiol-disulfide isomerase/thioredoxin
MLMLEKYLKSKKWILDILLVIAIVGMGLFVYHRFNQRIKNNPQKTDKDLGETSQNADEVAVDESDIDQTAAEIKAEPALPFNLENLKGENVALSDFLGKPVMVNFWATWCPPCRKEMPIIQEFAAANQGELIVLAVNAGEDKATVQNFVENQSFPNLNFLLDPTNSVAVLYGVPGYPTSLFIDAEGLLRTGHIGELDETLLINYLTMIGVE